MIRLFVALALPEPVLDALERLQSGLPGARWRPRENFHLTLRFIGEVNERDAASVDDALLGIHSPAFELALSGCGAFGGKRPRAVWAGISPNPALQALHEKVDGALRKAGFPSESRKYTPHVTLAYLRQTRAAEAAQFTAERNLFSTQPFLVEDFHLYSSWTGGETSTYRSESSYALSRSK